MYFSTLYIILPIVLVAAFILATSTVKILREYERAVVFTLGRFQKVKGPGLGPVDFHLSRKWSAWISASRSSRYQLRM